MQAITDFFNELIELISLIWDLKTLVIVVLVVVVLFLAWGKIVGVVKDTKEVFKGGKNND